ncbi:hypothetical protein FLL45_08145 [Aliikangiella marina]|uniref:Uncharacterized protein n=1 Tax=Aliikangiella marina TaxID=1712262 RepID=A0A545TCH6_9GAMM|nr:hypothetical protein [Aliikangiella marina]TQV74920.1 hypothetical protein FLL45_08145 [Aliikangiella marina]
MKKYFILITMLLISQNICASEFSQDTGKVANLYVTPGGTIAFKLSGGRAGIPNAVAKFSCTTNGGWIGHETMKPIFESAILAAKTAGNEITVTIDGCEGGWFKVKDIYFN